MAAKGRKPGHIPEMYPCKNPDCERTTPLDVQGYRTSRPVDEPASQIHRVSEPSMPGFVLICSNCGHYTVVN